MADEKSTAVASFIGNLFGLAIVFLLVWIFSIEGGKEYGWFAGMFHGGWVPYNWIRSWFFDGIYLQAPLHTTMYSVMWWIFCALGVPCAIIFILRVISSIRALF